MSEQADLCPICFRNFPQSQLEEHVNKCIFLNSMEPSRKRPSTSPLSSPSKSPTPRKTFNFKSKKGNGNSNESQNGNFKIFTSAQKNNNNLKTQLNSEEKTEQLGNMNCNLVVKNPARTSQTESMKVNKNVENNKFDKHSFSTPLATQLQPKSLDQFFGQEHVLGKATILRQLLEKGDIPNMILWGPPGCGKTSLSAVVKEICKANPQKLRYVALCAANCGVKDVQNVVSDAKMQLKFCRKTVLFMDEIHRFNKKQQDVFLLHVEKGDIILLGATTENPSFSLNNALLSRCRVIVMEKLTSDNLYKILSSAVTRFNVAIAEEGSVVVNGDNKTCIEKGALEWLADTSDGDARIALSNLELLLQQSENQNRLITVSDIKEGIKKSHLLYDRKGEEHYNIISAMHKSIRGSDANAALYWTTRMIVSGEDPLFIARRMVRAASEDIGNSDPNALQLAVATMQGCQLLGMPEADVLLAQCAIYLARAPKSREADSALAAAKKAITQCEGLQPSVPMHIRNAPTKLMKELGYGKLAPGKKASFMPEGLENVNFFK